jgi:hypothetical protein
MNVSLWRLLAPISIALLPALLHVIDKVLENISPITKETLRSLMVKDKRTQAIGENKALYEAVRTYFDFERDCHFIFVLTVFSVLSLYAAQSECTGSFVEFTAVTLIMIVILLIFLGIFFVTLVNRKIEAASVGATDWWRRPTLIKWWKMVAIIAFGVVIITDVVLHFSCVRAEGAGH